MSRTKDLSRKELIEQSFNCCMQAVRSYGPTMDDEHREGLLVCMSHFKKLYLDAIDKETA